MSQQKTGIPSIILTQSCRWYFIRVYYYPFPQWTSLVHWFPQITFSFLKRKFPGLRVAIFIKETFTCKYSYCMFVGTNFKKYMYVNSHTCGWTSMTGSKVFKKNLVLPPARKCYRKLSNNVESFSAEVMLQMSMLCSVIRFEKQQNFQ